MQGTLINPETYKAYNKAFYEAMVGPLKVQADFDAFKNTDYWEQYMLNAFQFSAAKSASELKVLQGLVFGKNGEKIPFEDYKEQAMKVVQQFNEQWLRVEYDLAGRGAVMAEKWREMWKDRDLYPYYIFRTRRDARVRPEHAELEGKIFKLDSPQGQMYWPPLDWNCRCTGEATDEGTPLTAAEAEKYKDNIGAGFEGNVGIDGIFPKTKSGSSYFQVLKNANEAKPEMFEEPKIKKPKETVYDKIAETESKIRNNKFETLVIYDKQGNQLYKNRGGKSSVRIADEDLKLLKKDAIWTHNHPYALNAPKGSMKRIGNSFSPLDITTASKYNASEIRAVTETYTFIMQRPKDGWPSVDKIKKFYNSEHNKLYENNSKRINEGTTTSTKAEIVHWHIINREAAKHFGMKYTKFKAI